MKMKTVFAAALLAVSAMAVATPAIAGGRPDFRVEQGGGYRDAGPRGDGYRDTNYGARPDARRPHRRPAITLVTRNGAFSFQRDDRLFYTLVSAPYSFRPGFTYEYRQCFRRGCEVLVYRGHDPRPIDRIVAPRPPMMRADMGGWRDDNWRNDSDWRGDGERWQRGPHGGWSDSDRLR